MMSIKSLKNSLEKCKNRKREMKHCNKKEKRSNKAHSNNKLPKILNSLKLSRKFLKNKGIKETKIYD